MAILTYNNMNLLLRLEDFDPSNTFEDLAFSAFVVFMILWIIEWTTYFICGFIKSDVTATSRNKTIIGRHTMDFVSMVTFSILGYQAYTIMGFDVYHELKHENGILKAPGAERSYHYVAAAQRLCLFHIAYESKNFVDSIIHNDGIIFLAHHFCTGLLATYALNPVFHIYSVFFLGMSEISTTFLCVLVCFDAQHGIPVLGERYPLLMKVLGILFAVTFTFFRVILWPWVSYKFFEDAIILLQTGTAHANHVVYTFMIFDIGLTILQVYWLSEIVTTSYKILTSTDQSLVLARGDTKKSQ